MKEQDNITRRGLRKTNISNISDRECKVMIIKIHTEFEKRGKIETLNTYLKYKKT